MVDRLQDLANRIRASLVTTSFWRHIDVSVPTLLWQLTTLLHVSHLSCIATSSLLRLKSTQAASFRPNNCISV